MLNYQTRLLKILPEAYVFLFCFVTFNLVATMASGTTVQHRYGGKYTVPLSSEPASLDPAFITDIYSVTVANNLYDGLVEFDRDLNIVPAIAKIWKISRDHRSYSFQLRQGVKFHNGREVTADDFVYSLSRILHPNTRSPVASFFMNIRGAREFNQGKAPVVSGLKALNRYLLKIELDHPFAPFLSILAMTNAKVVPKEIYKLEVSRHSVGTGPFKQLKWHPGNEIVLAANDDYFGGRPFLDKIHFRIYPNIEWEKVFSDFEMGFLDQSIIPSEKYSMVTAEPKYRQQYSFISRPSLNLVYIGINCRVKPFDDVRVRQALSLAVDTRTIVESITRRGAIPANGILPPGIAGFDPRFKGSIYDPAQARRLLAEAGYPGGKGIPPQEIWTVSKSKSVHSELEAYRNYWKAIGIKIVPKVAGNWKEFISLINARKVPLYYAAWYADYPDPDNFLYVLCNSASGTNRMGYRNSKIDQMLEDARQEIDYLKRIELYRDTEKMVVNDTPLIPQHINSFNYLFQPWVKGVEVNYLGAAYIPFRRIWLAGRESQQ